MMIILFGLYTFVCNILFFLMELLPPFFRMPLYSLALAKCGKKTYIDYNCYFRYPKQIIVGDRTTINRGNSFFASHHYKDVTITIGNNVAIAPMCSFFAASHDYTKLSLPDIAKSITVGDNVWIGGRSIILPGVTIGEGAVVGAGSVVTKNVDPYSVVAGVPAKVVAKRVIFENE